MEECCRTKCRDDATKVGDCSWQLLREHKLMSSRYKLITGKLINVCREGIVERVVDVEDGKRLRL
jgi:hypothetical protein